MKGTVTYRNYYLLGAVSFLMLVLMTACTTEHDTGINALNLSGLWKIIITDSPEYASPDFDDSRFPGQVIPGDWGRTIEKNDDLTSTIWLRKKVIIGSEWQGRLLSLVMGRIGIADEAWFNGQQIGGTGVIPGKGLAYHMSWQNPRVYHIPSSLIRYGGNNVVALRIYSHVLNGISGSVELADVSSDYFSYYLKAFGPMITNFVSLFFNMLFFLGLLILYMTRREKREYLYFSIIVLLTLLCNLLTLESPFSLDGLVRYKLFLSLYVLANFFVFLGVGEFLNSCNRYTVTIYSLLLAVVEGLIAFSPSTVVLIRYGGFAAIVLINIFIFSSAFLFFNSARKDPRGYWYFLFIAIPVPISVMRNSWYLISFRFNELPLVIFMHVPLVFTLFSVYYIYEFERTRREKDNLYSALLKKSQRFQRMINAMQKTDSKPEPRDVINEVIEYLDDHYRERYDRKELSKKFGLNEDYMGQVFRKVAGTNISSYINTRRIEAAKDLLADTEAKIIDIAYHVGFDNLTHFHRQFKRQTNLTPSEYRAVMKEDA